jgi:flagellar basal-body rod modification protein FlgD
MEIGSATNQMMDYMTLLITELQNQNPLDPLNNQQMAQQLAQFSQLEMTEEMNGNIGTMNSTMEAMNSTFQGTLLMAEYDYARSLLGKQVSFYSNDYEQNVTGNVSKLRFENGVPKLEVQGNVILSDGTQSEGLTFTIGVLEITGIQD